jgi:ATPase subunit of ABC transporter with duplicated ATPase domains
VRDGELYRYEGGYSAWRESKEARRRRISASAAG